MHPLSRSLVVIALTASLACTRQETAGGKAATKKPAPTATSWIDDQVQGLPAGTEVGSRMPRYTAKLLDGSTFDTSAERGNVVLLNLWATWCPPCRYEIPELQAMHDRLKSRNFKVVGVSVDEGATDEVRNFVREQSMTYLVAHDAEANLANLLDTSVLPTSILIDRYGKIVWRKMGAVEQNDAELVKALEKAL